MAKAKKHRISRKKAFTSPGTLMYVGKESSDDAKIKLLRYNEKDLFEKSQPELDTLQVVNQNQVAWINIKGIHDIALVESVGSAFQLHSLLLEDVLNTTQRPKIEHFGDHQISVILKALKWNDESQQVDSGQLGLVLGEHFVLSFQESSGIDIFKPIEDRLKASVGKTRKGQPDYLFYTLCDVAIDSYYIFLDEFSELLETLEQRIIEHPQAGDLQHLYRLRTELMFIRKSIMPLRDVFLTLTREDSALISPSTNVYFRDLYDHVLQILDGIESHRDMIENIQNIYLNTINTKMNSVMKTLTLFTAIFMPLSFLAGIYGMNFENMPELRNPNGYFITLGAMAVLGGVMLVYFKWKKYM